MVNSTEESTPVSQVKLRQKPLFGIWSGRLLMAVTPYANQMRSSGTTTVQGLHTTSRTHIKRQAQ
jgi:hypothetical protein